MADSDPLSAALKKTFGSSIGSFFPAANGIFSPQHEDQGNSLLMNPTRLSPQDLDRRYQDQQKQNEGARARAMNEPLASALKQNQTFAQNDRQDLLKDAENTFYGGGNAQPTPTPTPAPVKPHQLTLEQLYDHFGVDNPVQLAGNFGRPLYQNQPDTQVYKAQYGYPS